MAPTIAVCRSSAGERPALAGHRFFEIHEAFAAQVLATLKAWEIAEYIAARGLGREPAARRQSTGRRSTSRARASPTAILLPPPARASWR